MVSNISCSSHHPLIGLSFSHFPFSIFRFPFSIFRFPFSVSGFIIIVLFLFSLKTISTTHRYRKGVLIFLSVSLFLCLFFVQHLGNVDYRSVYIYSRFGLLIFLCIYVCLCVRWESTSLIVELLLLLGIAA